MMGSVVGRLPVGILAVCLLTFSFVVSVAPSASAHDCRANTHEGCNGHTCIHGAGSGPHTHVTEHEDGINHRCVGVGLGPPGGSPPVCNGEYTECTIDHLRNMDDDLSLAV